MYDGCCSVGTIPTVVLGIRLYSIRCENTIYCSTRLFRATFYKRERVECTKMTDDNVASVRLHREVTLWNEFDAKKKYRTRFHARNVRGVGDVRERSELTKPWGMWRKQFRTVEENKSIVSPISMALATEPLAMPASVFVRTTWVTISSKK